MVKKSKSAKEKPVLEMRNVHKSYTMGKVNVPVLHGIDIQIWKGDFIALVGVSGSGKSTAMNIMGCLDTPTKGEVLIDGIHASKMEENELARIRGDKIGFVFQQFNLLGALDCRENVALPLYFQKKTGTFKLNGEVDKIIKSVNLSDRANHKPLEMSGGEQQRAAIARALVGDPEIIIADEPTGNLDSKTGKMIMEIFSELNKKGKTIVVVTHDPNIAKGANKLIRLKDGKIVKNGEALKKIVWKNHNHTKK